MPIGQLLFGNLGGASLFGLGGGGLFSNLLSGGGLFSGGGNNNFWGGGWNNSAGWSSGGCFGGDCTNWGRGGFQNTFFGGVLQQGLGTALGLGVDRFLQRLFNRNPGAGMISQAGYPTSGNATLGSMGGNSAMPYTTNVNPGVINTNGQDPYAGLSTTMKAFAQEADRMAGRVYNTAPQGQANGGGQQGIPGSNDPLANSIYNYINGGQTNATTGAGGAQNIVTPGAPVTSSFDDLAKRFVLATSGEPVPQNQRVTDLKNVAAPLDVAAIQASASPMADIVNNITARNGIINDANTSIQQYNSKVGPADQLPLLQPLPMPDNSIANDPNAIAAFATRTNAEITTRNTQIQAASGKITTLNGIIDAGNNQNKSRFDMQALQQEIVATVGSDRAKQEEFLQALGRNAASVVGTLTESGQQRTFPTMQAAAAKAELYARSAFANMVYTPGANNPLANNPPANNPPANNPPANNPPANNPPANNPPANNPPANNPPANNPPANNPPANNPPRNNPPANNPPANNPPANNPPPNSPAAAAQTRARDQYNLANAEAIKAKAELDRINANTALKARLGTLETDYNAAKAKLDAANATASAAGKTEAEYQQAAAICIAQKAALTTILGKLKAIT